MERARFYGVSPSARDQSADGLVGSGYNNRSLSYEAPPIHEFDGTRVPKSEN